jgi:hypothetical protein
MHAASAAAAAVMQSLPLPVSFSPLPPATEPAGDKSAQLVIQTFFKKVRQGLGAWPGLDHCLVWLRVTEGMLGCSCALPSAGQARQHASAVPSRCACQWSPPSPSRPCCMCSMLAMWPQGVHRSEALSCTLAHTHWHTLCHCRPLTPTATLPPQVLKLGAFRLVALSDNVDFSPLERNEVLERCYVVFQHALFGQTRLFYNRHLDQVLLCTLYGFSKVNRLPQVGPRAGRQGCTVVFRH